MRERLKRLCVKAGALLACGIGYALLCTWADGSLLVCPFHFITGLYCPGCGVSRMCLALLRLDVDGAFRANAALTLMAPFGALFAVQMAVKYVRGGSADLSRVQSAAVVGAIVILVVFGVLRNTGAFSFLAPR